MPEYDWSTYWKVDVLTPELQSMLGNRLRSAVATCLNGRGEPNFRNVITEAMVLGEMEPSRWLVNGDNLELIYQYVLERPELGIRTYSQEIEGRLDVEPDLPVSRMLIEHVGWVMTRELPKTFTRVKQANNRPSIARLDQCERGFVGLLVIEGGGTVIKSTLSEQESEIAVQLGEENLAPKIYEHTQRTIAEEYINSQPLLRHRTEPSFVGLVYGLMLGKLHELGIIYGNRMYDHIFIETNEEESLKTRIIDLEAAHRGQEFDIDLAIAESELASIFENGADLVLAGRSLRGAYGATRLSSD